MRFRRAFCLSLIGLMAALLAAPAAPAATPPALVNYQGVLRDAADKPRSGSFDMVFRFFSAASAGDEILVDSRLAANAIQWSRTMGGKMESDTRLYRRVGLGARIRFCSLTS